MSPGAPAGGSRCCRPAPPPEAALLGARALRAFGDGLVVQSLFALWLFERFGLSLATAGAIFFWTS